MQVLYKYRSMPIHLELHSSYSTPLTDYLRLSRLNPLVMLLRYYEMPMFFRWDTEADYWVQRRKFVYLIFRFYGRR